MTDFNTFLKHEKTTSQQTLATFIQKSLSDFRQLNPEFTKMLEYLPEYITTGGKWARPTLVRLAHNAITDTPSGNLLLGSAAIELFHRFILCHDDIIDQDLVRHGLPTLEQHFAHELEQNTVIHPIDMYAQGMAMISGDLLHSLVYEVIYESGFNAKITRAVIHGLHECIMHTVAGWRLETVLKQRAIKNVTLKEVDQAMLLVSGYYSVLWPLRFGQLFAGYAYADWLDWLEIYGSECGIAFQTQDDILGMFGDHQVTGKPVGSDFREGKKTHLLLFAYQHANSADQAFLEKNLGNPVDSQIINRVQTIMKKTGALAYATQKAHLHAYRGIAAIPKGKNEVNLRLRQLGEYLSQRDH